MKVSNLKSERLLDEKAKVEVHRITLWKHPPTVPYPIHWRGFGPRTQTRHNVSCRSHLLSLAATEKCFVLSYLKGFSLNLWNIILINLTNEHIARRSYHLRWLSAKGIYWAHLKRWSYKWHHQKNVHEFKKITWVPTSHEHFLLSLSLMVTFAG